MTKYKWSLLGLIVSIILFLVFMINPLIEFSNLSNKTKFIPTEPIPEEIHAELYKNAMDIVNRLKEFDISMNTPHFLKERRNLVKIIKSGIKMFLKNLFGLTLSGIGKSFYHWNLF